ncbi:MULTISPECIES: terminase family protein [Bordetella]|uniref:Bbp25 n=2 Tax=root TaxID=1 RepID=Q775B9_BPBPP|nr:terminase family protein [Bordetella bronchiseptica]NP_958694.1 terminase family protein [Bordetella phage BPP-1]AAR97691.1 Bbp25 [Bordetella phage BPP-1]KCV31075.1 Terminase-like domain protein [Bordetella bronchiseptica 00-P-2796]KDB80737.1 Terminase-like domain protein [Bordetella bronchiseptica CARE970018BB]KDC00007.1 Terminase-like domain protein [Bordetella bronchiseptica E010]KDC01373.1 Terminase-like domain protein [Bordetella bronchiseptica D993]
MSSVAEIRRLMTYMTPAELAEVDALLATAPPWLPLPGPQTAAYNSDADIIGYGGAAGGGKTDLIAGLTLTKHERALIVRREKAQTEGFVQRMTEIMGGTDGYNSQKGFWRLPGGRLCELAGLDNPGDERRWQGRPHDLKAFDEVTEQREQQVRFVMGWNRTNKPGQRSRVLMTFNPPTTSEGRWVIDFFAPWLDKKHPLYPTAPGALRWVAMLPDGNGGSRDTWFDSDGNPLSSAPFVLVGGRVEYDFDPADYNPEDIIQPKSRTFIPARVTDNPYYVDSGYLVTLQSLPEPLRSQMLYGDFNAGIEDDPWQVIPTAWVEAAQARWKRPDRLAPMDSLGVDVARGGRDNTILARRHAMWFDVPLTYPGKDTPDGPTVAGLAIAALRDHAVIHLDVIGVGASPYDFLAQAKQQVVGVNVAEAARGTDKSGRLRFFNLRSELWWRMREALDPTNNTGIALPPDPRLLADLTAPTWSLSGATLKVASREDIIEKIGRSPDFGSAYVLALMDTPKRAAVEALGQARSRLDYDPYARM